MKTQDWPSVPLDIYLIFTALIVVFSVFFWQLGYERGRASVVLGPEALQRCVPGNYQPGCVSRFDGELYFWVAGKWVR